MPRELTLCNNLQLDWQPGTSVLDEVMAIRMALLLRQYVKFRPSYIKLEMVLNYVT